MERAASSPGIVFGPPGPSPRSLALAAAFFAAYFLLDWVSFIHPLQQYGITPWNPQAALAIALLALGGQRWLPVLVAAIVAAEWGVRDAPAGWPWTLLVATVLALGYAAIAHVIAGRYRVDPAIARRGDALRLAAIVTVGTLLTGFLYVAALVASGVGPIEDPFAAVLRFWIGDAVGTLVTLPILLMLAVPDRRRDMRVMLRQRGVIAHLAVLALALAVVVASAPGDQVRFFYVLFLPLILVAMQFGLPGAAFATLVIQGALIITGELASYRTITVLELQALLIALTVTGLFLGVTVDERSRAEAELRHSLRMAAAGEMAAALAHELNQPLTAVTSYARAAQLLARSHDPERLLETLEKLTSESTRAADVVRRLRDFFRSGSTHLAPLSLGELVRQAVETHAPHAQSRGVELVGTSTAASPVLVDEIQVQVVLRNLVANAVDAAAAAPAPRRVEIEAGQEGEMARIGVTDTGPGVDAAGAARIFEPFTSTRASGMGMGLPISRAIVEAHGGQLWVEPGERGRFYFTLPLAEAAHA